jgi:hypothetical protein
MTTTEELAENRFHAAEVAIDAHTQAIAGTVFTDEDPAQNLSQLLTSLQAYAAKMGINFQAACEGDDANLWIEPGEQTQAPTV